MVLGRSIGVERDLEFHHGLLPLKPATMPVQPQSGLEAKRQQGRMVLATFHFAMPTGDARIDAAAMRLGLSLALQSVLCLLFLIVDAAMTSSTAGIGLWLATSPLWICVVLFGAIQTQKCLRLRNALRSGFLDGDASAIPGRRRSVSEHQWIVLRARRAIVLRMLSGDDRVDQCALRRSRSRRRGWIAAAIVSACAVAGLVVGLVVELAVAPFGIDPFVAAVLVPVAALLFWMSVWCARVTQRVRTELERQWLVVHKG